MNIMDAFIAFIIAFIIAFVISLILIIRLLKQSIRRIRENPSEISKIIFFNVKYGNGEQPPQFNWMKMFYLNPVEHMHKEELKEVVDF